MAVAVGRGAEGFLLPWARRWMGWGVTHVTMDNPPPLLAPHLATPPPSAPTEDKALMILSHLSGLLGVGVILPLIIYLIKKDGGGATAAHAKEALNFHLSLMIYAFAALPLIFVGVGLLVFPVIIVGSLVLAIIAAVKAGDGVLYRYPLCIRFIS